ncbi:hypothetical protein BDY21DRAFT_16330 [Lineolata rhizophorae]|uniref:Uncharacterized protein n=1 Tax=Lineolata rhizophorae TaxID=578093 RepID=A0A6A6P192_9PEZI|nr:hypothetical protein BDY21DRAFT_16330 [Lineolata rhizophorae]
MPSTPPPPEGRRVHTPPAPLHGPKFDEWDPYSSPRRSSRVAAQQEQKVKQTSSVENTPTRSGRAAASNSLGEPSSPTSSRKRGGMMAAASGGSGGLRSGGSAHKHRISPPPMSPSKRARATPRKSGAKHLLAQEYTESDSANEDEEAPPSMRKLRSAPAATMTNPGAMFPTPVKTPNKPDGEDETPKKAALSSTARVLFPSSRTAKPEDAMPTPRRRRKHLPFTLGSFEDEVATQDGDQIQIYTDTKERIPELDEGEDNPFVTPKGRKTKQHETPKRKKERSKEAEEEEERMQERVRNNEGLIYVFRGKKVFRKFEDAPQNNASREVDEAEETLSDRELRRMAGSPNARRLPRTDYKPRLLWPSEEQRREREAAAAANQDDDEEAITEIDSDSAERSSNVAPATTPTRKGTKKIEVVPVPDEPEPEAETETHANTLPDPFNTSGPSRSARKPRFPRMQLDGANDDDDFDDAAAAEDKFATAASSSPSAVATGATRGKGKKMSPFDQWRRSKASVPDVKGTKREGSSLQRGAAAKRRA